MTEYKLKLEEEKKTLMDQLASLGSRDAATSTWEVTTDTGNDAVADANTSASRFEDFEEKSALMVPLEARLAQVDAALDRLAHGGFGVCRVCSNPIEEDRLGANPAAETCKAHLES
jgi:RNA polymerase-binding transcription factor DksA